MVEDEDEEGGDERETTGEKNSLLKFMNPAPATTSNGKEATVCPTPRVEVRTTLIKPR